MQDLTLAEPAGASDGLLPKPKLRPTPQLRDKDPVTKARLYANDAELQEARELHAQEKVQHEADYKAWRAQQDKLRDRSGRQRDGEHQDVAVLQRELVVLVEGRAEPLLDRLDRRALLVLQLERGHPRGREGP